MQLFWKTTTWSSILSIVGGGAIEILHIWVDGPLLWHDIGLLLSENEGIAFGMNMPPVIMIPLIALALYLVVHLAQNPQNSKLTLFSLGLIMGGGIANLVDRIRDGTVTDYFKVLSFPVFNFADSCISVGVALLAISWLFLEKKKAS